MAFGSAESVGKYLQGLKGLEEARSKEAARAQTDVVTDVSEKVEEWKKEVLGHLDDEKTQKVLLETMSMTAEGLEAAKKRIEEFLSTEASRQIAAEWIIPPRKPPYCFTDMSDVYKPSMMGAFARIQRKMDQKHGPDAFKVRLTINVRQSSELPLEELFKRACEDGTEWARLRNNWLKAVLELTARKFDAQILKDLPHALPLPLKGVVRIEDSTLKELEAQPHIQAISLRLRLKATGKPQDQWLDVSADQTRAYVACLPGGTPEPINDAILRLSADTGFQIVFDAEGPWHLTTFCETSLMQETAHALGQGMQLLRGWSDANFYAMGLLLLDQRMEFLDEYLGSGNPFDVFLFAGRRSTHAGYHLLQNLWCTRRLRNYKGTSSLFAYRVFRDYGWIEPDGSPKQPDFKDIQTQMPLVGTHAHEASMAFQGICAAEDDEFEYPISSLLWHLNYWLLTGNQAALPDTMGSSAFIHMLSSLQFPPKFVARFNLKHHPKQLKGGISIAEELKNPGIGGLIRQDSGDISAFTKTCFPPPILLKPGQGWVDPHTGEPSQGYKCLASEISEDQDVRDVRELGYLGIGTGGYLGEKPWKMCGGTGINGEKLSGRIDLVAKISSVTLPGAKGSFYPVKLGDFKPECWHHERPAKFAVSPELDGAGDDSKMDALFKRYQRQGEVDHGPFFNLNNYSKEERKPKRFDKDVKWRQERFEEMWEQFCFTDDA